MATPVQEARWVLRAQCGDREALELLLTAIRPSLARYVRGLVGPSDAEDLLQDILLIVYRKLKLLQQPEVFRAWVFRVASRAAFRYLKSETDGLTGPATRTRSNTSLHLIRRRAKTLSSRFWRPT